MVEERSAAGVTDPKASDVADKASSDRDRTSERRDRTSETRDRTAAGRDRTSEGRDRAAEARDRAAEARDRTAGVLEAGSSSAPPGIDDRRRPAVGRRRTDVSAESDRASAASDRADAASDRKAAGAGREKDALDRSEASDDRNAASGDRERASVDRDASAREREVSSTDDLTGAYRRGTGLVELEREMLRAKRTSEAFVVAFVDVDGLKSINDSQGHDAGDRLLRRVVDALRSHLRSYDLIIRFGGDEFVCGMSNLGLAEATQRFDRINADLADNRSSVTVGLAELKRDSSVVGLIAEADEALYEARRAGPGRQ